MQTTKIMETARGQKVAEAYFAQDQLALRPSVEAAVAAYLAEQDALEACKDLGFTPAPAAEFL